MNINKTMQDAFNAQISQELYSSNLYLQMAFWFRKEGWKGFATWMAKQSDEEKRHAMDMADFVLNRGGEVKLTAIEAVPTEWGSPKEVFEATMAHEQLISSLIDKLAEVADEQKDRAAIATDTPWPTSTTSSERVRSDDRRERLPPVTKQKGGGPAAFLCRRPAF